MSARLDGWLPVYAAPAEGHGLGDLGARQLGVGKAAAAASTIELLLRLAPRGVLLFGVCGAFPARHRPGAELQVGALCVVGSDRFGDEGAAVPDGFMDLAALGLGEVGPFAADPSAVELAGLLDCPLVDGVTVSTCSGTEATSAAMAARSGAAIETMEGAAVALACARHRVPFVQVRAVSNRTGDRAQGGWDLPGAIAAAQRAVRTLLA